MGVICSSRKWVSVQKRAVICVHVLKCACVPSLVTVVMFLVSSSVSSTSSLALFAA